jgi:hypothetical protein
VSNFRQFRALTHSAIREENTILRTAKNVPIVTMGRGQIFGAMDSLDFENEDIPLPKQAEDGSKSPEDRPNSQKYV